MNARSDRNPPFLPVLVTLVILLSTAGAGAQNQVLWTTNYYAVTGATLPEIHQSLARSRPWKDKKPFDGQTDWKIEWRSTLVASPGGWRCSSFTTKTTIQITLPYWMPPTNAAPTIRHLWHRYITALGRHELGHAQLALAAAAEQRKRVQGVGEESDSAALKEKINRIARQVLAESNQRHAEYDQRTDHGVKEGVFLPRRARGE